MPHPVFFSELPVGKKMFTAHRMFIAASAIQVLVNYCQEDVLLSAGIEVGLYCMKKFVLSSLSFLYYLIVLLPILKY